MTLANRPYERTAALVDGLSLFATHRALGFDIDYKLLLAELAGMGHLLRATYYTPMAETDGHAPARALVDWLEFNGWSVVTKPARHQTDDTGKKRMIGNTDLEIAIDALTIAPTIDHIILFSGKAAFLPLVIALKSRGVRLTVVSSIQTDRPMASEDLRRAADHFIDLANLRNAIARIAREGVAA